MEPGKAYGFFECRASAREIEAELPTIRELAETPSDLEFALIEGVENLNCDGKLRELAEQAGQEGMRYVLEAYHPNAANSAVADEVSYVLSQMYQSLLYQEGEQFCGAVVFEEAGRFVFLE